LKGEEEMIDLSQIIHEDSELKREKQKIKDEKMTVREYLNLVEKDPRIAQNSASRGEEIICGPNGEEVVEVPEENRWDGIENEYPFFSKELFGVRRPTARFVEVIKAAKHRASLGKQVILFVGPPASGKSTFVREFTKGYEDYNIRPVYMIEGCPKFEEPLHVLPRHLREEFEEKLGVRIEGDLCPICRQKLKEYTDTDGVVKWWNIPVERMSFSKQNRCGLTSFEPSDEKSSDVTALSGRENLQITAMHGYDHPRAYEISGEIPKAERGVCEGRELTSGDPSILQVFFSVAEERELKIPGSTFPHFSTDTVVVAHTNLSPFKEFASNKKYEGIHNRFYVITFPYPLRVQDELEVYKKLIERDSDFVRFKQCHIAPGALEVAALFAVLTRLTVSAKQVNMLTKARLYNGDELLTELNDSETGFRDVGELFEEGQLSSNIAEREGMFGVSSRDVLAAVNTEIVRQMSGSKCLTPLSVVRALRDTFKSGHRMGYSPEQIDRFMLLLSSDEEDSAITELDESCVAKVCKAFLHAYSDLSKELFDRYVSEDRYYRDTKRKFLRSGIPSVKKDPTSGKLRDPDLKFMRSVERHIPAISSEEEAEVFRGEILEVGDLTYESYSPLAWAVERKLLEDSKDMLQLVLATDKPLDSEAQKRVNDLFGAMQEKHGYCKVCATEAVEHTRMLLSK
jgi:serine protein kinase